MSIKFKKILIANRGEIAVRVIRACHELGINTVAVHSQADREALHVKLATESVCIGPNAAKDSYLNVASIMAAAVATQADAIHPGYGFLSENASFAEIAASCGVVFIGPEVGNMRMMGDKGQARQVAERLGIPTITGTSKGLHSVAEAREIADATGYPVLLKSCAGGGGRGMKIVNSPDELEGAFTTARLEVEAAFGDPSLIVEKYLRRVRHIEVQVAGDNFGNYAHFGIRDCSIQRRYQKVIEESPSIGLDPRLKDQIQQAALKLVSSVNYKSLGTVEFLVDLEDNKFYFIEMNTRLQVEHPVTEMVTGIDLVKEQINIAAGAKLTYGNEANEPEPDRQVIRFQGHCIEVRLNAENSRTMMPSPGLVENYHAPQGFGVRMESALYSGYRIPPFYDSMIGKLICYASTREECIQKVLVALEELITEGIETNIPLLQAILTSQNFVSGDFHTKFLDTFKW